MSRTVVTTDMLKDLAVTTAKVNDLAVTAGKLAADAVTTAKILDANITTAKIADGAVTAGKLSAGAQINLATQQATTSGTFKDFTVPAGTKRVTIMFNGVSFDTASTTWLVRLGDAGGIETTGYYSAAEGVLDTTGFHILDSISFGDAVAGKVVLDLMNAATFTWVSTGVLYGGDSGITVTPSGGTKSLSAELTTVRITTLAGTAVFDAGTLNISYE